MPKVPKLVGQTVGTVVTMPIFTYGVFRLALIPPSAGPTQTVTNQDPEAGTMLDFGGVVTAMVATQGKQFGQHGR